jgi:hypothetical protein
MFASLLTIITTGCRGNSQDNLLLEPPDVELVAPGSEESPALPEVTVTMGNRGAVLEVVEDPEERRQGLMYRDSLASDAGMLFVFTTEVYGPFWMKNTYIPLSIAFISSDSVIIDIHQMEPLDTVTKHMPDEPYQYAVEMNEGWFTEHGVKVGDKVKIPQLP